MLLAGPSRCLVPSRGVEMREIEVEMCFKVITLAAEETDEF